MCSVCIWLKLTSEKFYKHTALQAAEEEVSTLQHTNEELVETLSRLRAGVLQCVAVCCSVLLCVALCCSVLLCAAVCVAVCVAVCCSVLQCAAMCCSVLWCAAMCCSLIHCCF